MKPKFTFFRRTCKQTAALLIAREDRALNLSDQIALKLHLMACKACPHFDQQIQTMRAAMAHWRKGEGERDAPIDAAKGD